MMGNAQILFFLFIQVWLASTSTTAKSNIMCTADQEIVCPSNNTFAWCMFTNHQDLCPSGLFCDPNLSYICSEFPPQPALTTSFPEPTTTFAPPEEEEGEDDAPVWEEDNEPWDQNSTPPSTCTKPGRYPDTSDCSIFHVCLATNLTHMELKCPQGSHFSARHDRCVEPERARCETQYQDFECPDIGPVPDPDDCAAFRICHRDGTWRRYECPSGSTFDPTLLRCSTSTQECAARQPGQGEFVCTAQGLYPDGKNCRKFYYCITGDGIYHKGEATCPRNSVFNPETKRCTIDLSVCRDVDKFCDERRPGKYPGSAENCSSFYLCGRSGSEEYSCPYGSSFNAVSGRCERESASHCGTHHLQCRKEGRFPDFENNCSGFYVCLNFSQRWKMQRYMCPAGSKFDFRVERCMPEESVICHMPVTLL